MSHSSNINIPSELWCIIGSKLDSFEDRVHFRAVSKSWRSLLPPPRHPPYMVLDESVGYPGSPPHRHFMFLGKQEIYKLDFPKIRGGRCIGSAGDWLITLHEDKTVRLTNLFSKAQTHLPHNGLITKWDRLKKVVLSSSSFSLWGGRNCSAMAIVEDFDYKLAVVRPGDTSWTNVPLLEESHPIVDITFYKQKFYALDDLQRLMVCDVGGDVKLSVIAQIPEDDDDDDEDEFYDDDYIVCDDDDPSYYTRYYLVECSGELLVVIKFTDYLPVERKFTDYSETDYETDYEDIYSPTVEKVRWIKVYRFDFTSLKLNRLKSLGEHSLFFGYNGSCASVLASDYFGSVRKNCIYFVDSKIDAESDNDAKSGIEHYNVRVFDLKDKWYYPPHMSTSSHSPPVWIVPTRPR